MQRKLKLLDLFSGIGGFSLGLERSGFFETVAFCEIEEFPRRVLAKHWPEVPCYEDVRELTAERLAADGITVDAICGGFPCQDISIAGKRAGIGEGTRSGLWSEIVRLASELRPQFIIVENVANLLSGPSEQRGGWFGRILGDLAECGYDAEWENIPASALGAPHRRERVWIIAYPSKIRQPEPWKHIKPLNQEEVGFREANTLVRLFQGGALPYVCRRHDGVPASMDRVGACGNAVVPQIPELIGLAIGASLDAA